MAEQCAGGGVLFVNQATFEKQPALQRKMTDYFRFRHAHRALFADPGKDSYAEIAVVYSIPTMMYHDYQHSAAAAPLKAFSGIVRALEEGHLPFDVVIFNHPEVHADRVRFDQLKRYRLVVLPAPGVPCRLANPTAGTISSGRGNAGTARLIRDGQRGQSTASATAFGPLAQGRQGGRSAPRPRVPAVPSERRPADSPSSRGWRLPRYAGRWVT